MPTSIKPKYSHAVISMYSFDDDVCVHLCTSEEEAKNVLRDIYEHEVQIDTDAGHDFNSEIREDGWYAKITNHRKCGDTDVSEWRIGHVYR